MVAFDPFGPTFVADPYPEFTAHLRDAPVFHSPELDYWVVSRYADCRRALSEHETFSASNTLGPISPPCPAAGQALVEGRFRAIPTLTNVDPPAHTRTRRIAHGAFTPRRVAAMEDVVRGLVGTYLDQHLGTGRSDIVADLTWELPALVLFHILGVPASDLEEIKEGAKSRLLFSMGRAPDDEQVAIARGMARFWRYCEALAEDRRANPRNDFTTDLVHTPDASGTPLSQQEVSTILFGLLLAGHETTTNLLGNGLRRLLEQRHHWEALCADSRLIPNAIEELLRYDSSVIHWRRRTTREVELAGVTIPADANLLLAIGAANRDPAVFDRPDNLDIHRANASEHLSFGFGPHVCLGAPLARLEARIVFEELTQRAPDLRLVADQTFDFLPIISFRGPRSLWIERGS